MARIVIELTNRCNLCCQHCFDEQHSATGKLPLPLVEKVIQEGRDCNINEICFTGGEPTLHRDFNTIVRRVSEADYSFSFVSNGVSFSQIYPLLLEFRQWFTGVTFSLDGAREATHDQIRGKGSYRHVMRAVSVSVFKDLPFTLNMVLTRKNQGEVEEMVNLAKRLGSGGVRFGHLMPTADTARRNLDLSPLERRRVESRIWQLREKASVPVLMAQAISATPPSFPARR